ncbi:MAG: serine hydrolase domain-containing protein [Arenicellales bacterium]|nr:serine hydrolase domain-containing protein [Arenicellales bacterium]
MTDDTEPLPIVAHPGEASGLLAAGSTAALDCWLAGLVHAQTLPFAMTVIARAGSICYWRWCGEHGAGHDVAPATELLFRMYSMTKPVTALTALLLEQQGVLDLAAPVEAVLPELAPWHALNHPTAALADSVLLDQGPTLLQLLSHTSGISYGDAHGAPVDQALARHMAARPTLAGLLASLSELPLVFSPGSAWRYGFGLDLLGIAIMRVTGKSLGEVMRDLIFKPLAMNDTRFELAYADQQRLAALFQLDQPGTLTPVVGEPPLGPVPYPHRGQKSPDHWGGSGLVATASDWLRFAELLRRVYRGENDPVANPEVVRRMATNQLPGDIASLLPEGPQGFREWMPFAGLGMGCGVWVAAEPSRLGWMSNPGEFGWGGYANTVFWVDPVADASVLFLTQVMPSDRLGLRFDLHRLAARCLE